MVLVWGCNHLNLATMEKFWKIKKTWSVLSNCATLTQPTSAETASTLLAGHTSQVPMLNIWVWKFIWKIYPKIIHTTVLMLLGGIFNMLKLSSFQNISKIVQESRMTKLKMKCRRFLQNRSLIKMNLAIASKT